MTWYDLDLPNFSDKPHQLAESRSPWTGTKADILSSDGRERCPDTGRVYKRHLPRRADSGAGTGSDGSVRE